MKWTKKIPTEPGYYWIRGETAYDAVIPVYQYFDTDTLYVVDEGGNKWPLEQNAWWCGPMEPPTEMEIEEE